jgi:hypothetical protein
MHKIIPYESMTGQFIYIGHKICYYFCQIYRSYKGIKISVKFHVVLQLIDHSRTPLTISIYRNHPHTFDCLIQRSPSYSWLFSWAEHVPWMLIFSFHMLFEDASPLEINRSFQFDEPGFSPYTTHASDVFTCNQFSFFFLEFISFKDEPSQSLNCRF